MSEKQFCPFARTCIDPAGCAESEDCLASRLGEDEQGSDNKPTGSFSFNAITLDAKDVKRLGGKVTVPPGTYIHVHDLANLLAALEVSRSIDLSSMISQLRSIDG